MSEPVDPASQSAAPTPYLPPPAPRPKRTGRWVAIIIAAVLIIGGAVTGALLGGAAVGRSLTKPTTFTSQDGYQIVFPGTPTAKKNASTGLRQAEVVRGKDSFLVESETLPNSTSTTDAARVLSSALDGGGSALDGTPTSAKKTLTLDGEPAESQTFSISAGSVYILGALHNGNKFIGIIVINSTPAERAKFVHSFKFTH